MESSAGLKVRQYLLEHFQLDSDYFLWFDQATTSDIGSPYWHQWWELGRESVRRFKLSKITKKENCCYRQLIDYTITVLESCCPSIYCLAWISRPVDTCVQKGEEYYPSLLLETNQSRLALTLVKRSGGVTDNRRLFLKPYSALNWRRVHHLRCCWKFSILHYGQNWACKPIFDQTQIHRVILGSFYTEPSQTYLNSGQSISFKIISDTGSYVSSNDLYRKRCLGNSCQRWLGRNCLPLWSQSQWPRTSDSWSLFGPP